MVEQGVCWGFGPSGIILTVYKGMRIDKERLFLVVMIVLGESRHDAQVPAGGGRIGVRVSLDLAHQTADEMLYRMLRQSSTHGPKMVKT